MAEQFWPAVVRRGAGSSFHSDCAHLICDGAVRDRLTLPAQRRVRRKADFDAAYARGKRLGNGFFGVTVHVHSERAKRPPSRFPRPEITGPRIGLAVAVRIAGGSVQRNRIRRIIRESFRLHQHELPAADFVVSARPKARDASGPELHAAIAALWKKVIQQCATPPLS
jgi:ribonuclease P protein component